MKRDPLTTSRSEWHPVDVDVPPPFLRSAWERRVGDGTLRVLISDEPEGLHLSISHRSASTRRPAPRYPRWDEIAEARETFLPDEASFIMRLPPMADYVALHATTFHLHEEVQR